MLDTPQLLALHLLSLDKKRLNTDNLKQRIEKMQLLSFAQVVESIYKKCTEDEIGLLIERAEKELAAAAKLDILIITFTDPTYPERLKKLSNTPLILFVKGDVASLNAEQSLAVVGSRDATATAKIVATEIAKRVAATGVSIVSGLAVGCDTAGHIGALQSEVGKTIAVLANGLDRVFPVENVLLAKQIIAAGGCLVSIYPIGVPPNRERYYARNKIQNWLSDGTAIIQAAKEKCGTMATATHCREQRGTLFCLNPAREPDKKLRKEQYKGNNKLISEGVIDVMDAGIILHYLAAHRNKTCPLFFRGSPVKAAATLKRQATIPIVLADERDPKEVKRLR